MSYISFRFAHSLAGELTLENVVKDNRASFQNDCSSNLRAVQLVKNPITPPYMHTQVTFISLKIIFVIIFDVKYVLRGARKSLIPLATVLSKYSICILFKYAQGVYICT